MLWIMIEQLPVCIVHCHSVLPKLCGILIFLLPDLCLLFLCTCWFPGSKFVWLNLTDNWKFNCYMFFWLKVMNIETYIEIFSFFRHKAQGLLHPPITIKLMTTTTTTTTKPQPSPERTQPATNNTSRENLASSYSYTVRSCTMEAWVLWYAFNVSVPLLMRLRQTR